MTIPTFFNPYQIFLRHHFVGFLLLICCVTANAAIAKSGLSESQQTWIKAHPVIQYAPEVDYGPFIYVNKQKKVDGLSVDFLKLLEQKTGLQFIPTDPLSLNDNLTKAKLHQVDMLTSLRPNPQRAEYLGFTQAYVSIPAILVLSKEEKNKKSLGDMAAMRVAVGKGYAVEAYVREKFPKVDWVAVASDSVGIDLLVRHEISAVVMDEASLAFIKAQQHDASVTKGDPIGFEYQLSFAYRQDWPELGAILDYGLMSISTKERQLVMSKWLSQEDSSFFEKYAVLFAAMCMACTAMFIFLWVAYKKWRSTTAL